MNIPFAATALAWWVRRAVRRRPVCRLAEWDIPNTQRVLLVLTTGIGDAVFSSVLFASLRAAWPQADIRLLCRQAWQPLFAADPHLNGTIPYPGKFRAFWATVRALRAFSPQVSVVLHGNDPDILPLCYLAGSAVIVRIPTGGTVFPELLSNRERQQDQAPLPGVHYVDNRLRVLETLGFPVLTRSPAMYVPELTRVAVHRRMQALWGGRPYWVLHVHAADAYKSLPAALALDVVREGLRRFPGYGLVLSGGPDNRRALQALLPPDCADAAVWVAAGRLSLVESAACLAGAAAVVAPDTGVLHLAAALGRPVLGLYAPTRVDGVGPRSMNPDTVDVLQKPLTCDPCYQKRCPHRPVRCMQQFSSAEILDRLAVRLSV